MAGQKRHFVSTVYAGHLCDGSAKQMESMMEQSQFIEAMNAYCMSMNNDEMLRYRAGQVELCPKTGRLHGQLYTEWRRSFRFKELASRWPGDYTVAKDTKSATRTGGRDYCTSSGKWIDKPMIHSLPAFGEWRPEKVSEVKQTQKEIAIYCLIQEGMNPRDIAEAHPEVFFTHGSKIRSLWNALNGCD